MAYVAGDKILDDQYNTFVNSSSAPYGYNHFAGTGSGEYGLGETHIPTVSAATNIKAAHWNLLFTGMSTIAGHTADTLTSREAVSAGDIIAIRAAVEADLATLAASIAAGCPNTTAVSTSAALQSPVSNSTWYGTFSTTLTATFSSAANLRFFFNAGGKLRVTPARIGNGGTSGASGKDGAWDNLYTAMGNFDLKQTTCSRSGSGETETTFASTTGFRDLGTSYTTLIKLTDDTYPYTANTLEIQAKLDNANPDLATAVTFQVISTDGEAGDYTFTSGNLGSADITAYRNGQHRHQLFSVNTTTGGGLSNAYSPSSTSSTVVSAG